MKTEKIIELIMQELERAKKIHPNWPEDKIHASAVLAEECGELVQAANDYMYCRCNHDEKENYERMIEEAIQCGAMAIRFLENMENKNK